MRKARAIVISAVLALTMAAPAVAAVTASAGTAAPVAAGSNVFYRT